MTTTLSIALIVRNEEKTLGRCLDSVRGLANEIMVVDTGSTDGTREIAAAHGARVFHFPWCDDFSAARNESLRRATGQWVLWLDADEYFDQPNLEKVKSLVAKFSVFSVQCSEEKDKPPLTTEHWQLKTSPLNTEHWPLNTAFVMVQRSHHGSGQTGSRVQQVRLFPRHPEVRWEYRVHEQLLPSLRRAGIGVRFTDIVIEHTGYVEPALRDHKMERNLRLLHLDQADRPDDPFTLFNLGVGYSQLGKLAEAIGLLRRSLERSRPGDSIVPKLYAALVRAHDRQGQAAEMSSAADRYAADTEMPNVGQERMLRLVLVSRTVSLSRALKGPYHRWAVFGRSVRLPGCGFVLRAGILISLLFPDAVFQSWFLLPNIALVAGGLCASFRVRFLAGALFRADGLVQTRIGDFQTLLEGFTQIGKKVGTLEEEESHAGVDDGRAAIAPAEPATIRSLSWMKRLRSPSVPVNSPDCFAIKKHTNTLDRPQEVKIQCPCWAVSAHSFGKPFVRWVLHVNRQCTQTPDNSGIFLRVLSLSFARAESNCQAQKTDASHRSCSVSASMKNIVPTSRGLCNAKTFLNRGKSGIQRDFVFARSPEPKDGKLSI
jgi:glycosyltransferase involved in cell wall biosynthesis